MIQSAKKFLQKQIARLRVSLNNLTGPGGMINNLDVASSQLASAIAGKRPVLAKERVRRLRRRS